LLKITILDATTKSGSLKNIKYIQKAIHYAIGSAHLLIYSHNFLKKYFHRCTTYPEKVLNIKLKLLK